MKMTLEQALDICLPKWPECLIYGDKITVKQAEEIIRRTDSFFHWGTGNNHRFVEQAQKIMRIPQTEDFMLPDKSVDWGAYDKAEVEFKEKWGILELEYLTNSWISCSYIGGPCGWCNPTGVIANQINIGKWPEMREVYKELQTIAKAFPFLSFTFVLSNRELSEDDGEAVVSFSVHGGKVELIETVPLDVARKEVRDRGCAHHFTFNVFDVSRENYFSLDQLREWEKQVYGDNR